MTNSSISNNQITDILMIALGVMICVLIFMIVIFLVLKVREKKPEKKIIEDKKETKNKSKQSNKQISTQMDKRSIMDFMEFEKIQDNMIIVKEGKKYLMVIECKGVNYDLMAEAEKIGVEEGFQQFLNTLRHPIQIYIQTRTINLEKSINRYKDSLRNVEKEYREKQNRYRMMQESGKYTQNQLEKANFEVVRQKNLYEYGKDIIDNTEKMNLNRNVLNKNFYIIIPYYVEEIGSDKYDPEETQSIAFSELYTKAQAIIRTLSSCYVTGRILSSRELIELLYVAYNRDDAELLGTNKIMGAGYDDLYSTAIDIFEKKNRLLDEEIHRKAIAKANSAIEKVKSEKQKEVEEKATSIDELARRMAQIILKENENLVGINVTKKAIEEIKNEGKETKDEKEES